MRVPLGLLVEALKHQMVGPLQPALEARISIETSVSGAPARGQFPLVQLTRKSPPCDLQHRQELVDALLPTPKTPLQAIAADDGAFFFAGPRGQ
jgi:hypothetical protein